MDKIQYDLLAQLMAFEIGPTNATFSFRDRLARENHWTMDFTNKVISEYKRFIFLIVTTKKAQTPSDQVDQAWHLHMTYTESYWDEMCNGLLKQKIHHGPTKGGQQENQKYLQQYQQTLDMYQTVFGDAPKDIWPEPKERFADAGSFQRVNTRNFWMIKKPSINLNTKLDKKLLLAGVITSLAGTPYAASTQESSSTNIGLTVALVGAIAFIFVFAYILKKSNQRKNSSGSHDSSGGFFVGSSTSSKSKHSDNDSSGGSDGSSGCSSGCGGGCGS